MTKDAFKVFLSKRKYVTITIGPRFLITSMDNCHFLLPLTISKLIYPFQQQKVICGENFDTNAYPFEVSSFGRHLTITVGPRLLSIEMVNCLVLMPLAGFKVIYPFRQ